jgi:predicted dehydrogenase
MESTHEKGFAELGDRVDVVATVDIERERAKHAAQVLGAAKAATDYREVLDDVDAVLVVLPHHLHHEVGMAALRAGKHVLMEKPMANTEAECVELIKTAREVDRVLMTAYPMRFHPLVRRLKEMISDGELGDVFQVSIWTEQLTHYPQGHWGNSIATLGGGQFFSHGCHYVDLLLWFLGDPVSGTHVGTRVGTPWMEGEGTSNVSIEFASGALGYHFGTWGAQGTRLGYAIHAHGTKAMAELDFAGGELRTRNRDGVEVVARAERSSKYVQGELRHFLDCVESGERPETNGPASLQGLRVIWRLYEAEKNKTVADLRGLGLDAAE